MGSDRPHIKNVGRRRLITGWTTSLLGAVSAAAWCMSAFWWCGYAGATWEVELGGGVASFNRASSMARRGWWWERSPAGPRLSMLPRNRGGGSTFDLLVFTHTDTVSEWGRWASWQGALWPVASLCFIGGAGLVRSCTVARRRLQSYKCSACGYDLSGLGEQTACPECGHAR